MVDARRRRRSGAVALVAGMALAGCHSHSGASGPCPAADACNTVGTDESTGDCVQVPRADGTACDDDNVCTQQDICVGGTCYGTQPIVCAELDACGLPGACDAGRGCAAAAASPCVQAPVPVPLTGCALSTYSVATTLGGGAAQALLFDTGSSTLAAASSLCPKCGVTPVYTPDPATGTGMSSESTYADRSGWTGTVYRPEVGVGTLAPIAMDVAAMATQTAFFTPDTCVADVSGPCPYQGILGLGTQANTAPHTEAFLDRYAATAATGKIFTVQLCDAGGKVWFGGYDPAAVAAPLQFTPMETSFGYYIVGLADMGLGTGSLGLAADTYGLTIVDTGTSALLLPPAAYSALVRLAEANAGFTANFGPGYFTDGACQPAAVAHTRAALDQALPPLSVTLPLAGTAKTFTLTLPASQSYLTVAPARDGSLTYCPGIFSGSDGSTIFGAPAMRGLTMVYDVQAYQLGLAPSQGC